jgi:hypothetical protein
VIYIKAKTIINGIVVAILILSVISVASASLPSHAPKIKDKYGNSINWAGYAVDSKVGSVTDVKGTWVVPEVTSVSSTQKTQKTQNKYSAFWVGIDGDTSKTVEQIGTDSVIINGDPTYYAWYEFYPKPFFTIDSVPVKPGDQISAEVKYDQDKFIVSITDVTTGKSFSTSAKVNRAERNSAEWITEAPWHAGVLPLANFGQVDFSSCYATISGSEGSIGSFGTAINPITMVSESGADKATPSSLSADGTSFSVTWNSAGP